MGAIHRLRRDLRFDIYPVLEDFFGCFYITICVIRIHLLFLVDSGDCDLFDKPNRRSGLLRIHVPVLIEEVNFNRRPCWSFC